MDGRGSIAGICDNVFSNSSSSKPRQDHQGPAKCSRGALAAAICVGNAVRAFSNRYQALTPTQSVVRTTVARYVLSTSETARWAERGSSPTPFRAAQARNGPQRANVAPQLTSFGGSLAVAFRRASQESSLSGLCGA